jgi:hypothetical protein
MDIQDHQSQGSAIASSAIPANCRQPRAAGAGRCCGTWFEAGRAAHGATDCGSATAGLGCGTYTDVDGSGGTIGTGREGNGGMVGGWDGAGGICQPGFWLGIGGAGRRPAWPFGGIGSGGWSLCVLLLWAPVIS